MRNVLFYLFCGKGPEVLENYGDHEKSFFKINESVKARSDLFYLVINTRILNMRQSVFIFVCKKEEWQNFLDKNLKDQKDGSKKNKRDKTSVFRISILNLIRSSLIIFFNIFSCSPHGFTNSQSRTPIFSQFFNQSKITFLFVCLFVSLKSHQSILEYDEV